jgi:hypothetical protein
MIRFFRKRSIQSRPLPDPEKGFNDDSRETDATTAKVTLALPWTQQEFASF